MIDPGKRVAWSHSFFAHAPESVLYAETADGKVFVQTSTGMLEAPAGTVVAHANEKGSWLEVQLDGEEGTRVLTIDELAQINEAPAETAEGSDD